MKRKFPILKTLIIAALLVTAFFMAFEVPEAMQSFFPLTETVSPEKYLYSPTLSASGRLICVDGAWQAVVAVNEADISGVEKGQYASLSGAAFPDGIFSGEVSAVSDLAYTVTKNGALSETFVDVTLEITQGDVSLLRSGYSVTARLKTGEERTMLTLPYGAVNQDDLGEFVYILENGCAEKRYITTGLELSDKTEIVSGIERSDVVLLQTENLSEGQPVRIS